MIVDFGELVDEVRSYKDDKRFKVRFIEGDEYDTREGIVISWTDPDTAVYESNIQRIKKVGGFKTHCFALGDNGEAELTIYNEK